MRNFKINSGHVTAWQPVYANSLTAYNPELWARESVAILEESMVFGGLVHRDFNNEIARFGDIVNTRKPAEFQTNMFANGTDVTYQDASATNVPVKLDTVADVSFKIYDLEQSYSFANLVSTYLQPAILSIARTVDRKIAGQAAQFLTNRTTGQIGTAVTQAKLVATEKQLNDQKVPDLGRNLVVCSAGKADILGTAIFTQADMAGTDSALRRAHMGDLFGMNTYMSLNVPSTTSAAEETASTTTANSLAGATVIAATPNVLAGGYFTVAGDLTPLRVLSTAATYNLTTTRAVREATTSGNALRWFTQGAVDSPAAADYPIGHTGFVHVDTLAAGPHVGQLVSFGSGASAGAEYVICEVLNKATNDYDLVLDRGLDAVVSDGDKVNYGPQMNMNFAFHRNAITLVNRPLEVAAGAAGANMAVASSRNISIRVSTSWSQDAKALKVSVDALFGVKTLDTDLGCVLLS